MIVRAFEERDRPAVEQLFGELVEAHRELYPDGNIGATFALPTGTFVAEDGGEIVGYAGLEAHGSRAEIEPIVVAAEARRRGIGRALVEHVIAAAREGGATRVFARPVGRNERAQRFFHDVGLDVVGYVEVQLDLSDRERRDGPSLAGRTFRV